MDLGRVGIWTFHLDQFPWAQVPEIVQELEALGYGSIWLPEAVNRDPLVSATLVLGATQRMSVGTGIASIYARGPMAMNAAWQTISEAYPGRFVLGMGVSHAPAVEGFHGTTYGPPLAAMRTYLDAMDSALFFAPRSPEPPRRVLAALGPKMLALAAERADGAHPYLVTPEHTKIARDVLGPGKLLAVEQKVALTPGDAAEGRRRGRTILGTYLGLPNYTNNWKRLGIATDDDLADGGSDRLVDAMVAWGDENAIRTRVQEHLDAGADHVCIQVITPEGYAGDPMGDWRILAPVLLD